MTNVVNTHFLTKSVPISISKPLRGRAYSGGGAYSRGRGSLFEGGGEGVINFFVFFLKTYQNNGENIGNLGKYIYEYKMLKCPR